MNIDNFALRPTSNFTTVSLQILGFSENKIRFANKYNIRKIFKTHSTLRSLMTHTKPDNITKNFRNSLLCVCGYTYTGETSRP